MTHLSRRLGSVVLRMLVLSSLAVASGCWIGVPAIGDKGQKCFADNTCLTGLVCHEGQCLTPRTPCLLADPTPDAAGACQKRACDPSTGWESVADSSKDGIACGVRFSSGGTCSGGACFMSIAAGTFTIGSPADEPGRYSDETQHEVTISQGYYMEATDVTQGEWQSLMGNNPSNFKSCGSNCPVEQVSWWDAVAYANALSAKEGLQQCYSFSGCSGTPGDGSYTCTGVTFVGLSCTGYRLPTEAEWEYAARAGTTGGTYTGTSTLTDSTEPNSILDPIAWFGGNSGSTTHPVGQKQPNAWGLYDMLGNAWQWCWDWYWDYPSGSVTDPTGPTTGSGRVDRGGSWDDDARHARAADREDFDPGFRYYFLGFRLVRSR